MCRQEFMDKLMLGLQAALVLPIAIGLVLIALLLIELRKRYVRRPTGTRYLTVPDRDRNEWERNDEPDSGRRR